MSAQEEYDEAANDEMGQTGPGAPTPLQQLEVRADPDATRGSKLSIVF